MRGALSWQSFSADSVHVATTHTHPAQLADVKVIKYRQNIKGPDVRCWPILWTENYSDVVQFYWQRRL